MSCGVGRRCGSDQCVEDPVLLWLWCRPAAVALIRPLAWEPSYATGVALKSKKRRKEERKKLGIYNINILSAVSFIKVLLTCVLS